MRILHIALSCFYVEGLGYQENILPKYHAKMGNDVYMLTSYFSNSHLGNPKYLDQNEYTNSDNIHVIKLKRRVRNLLGKRISFNEYYGVYKAIEKINPDIIFMHGTVFLSINEVIQYLQVHTNVIAFADHHADYYNSPQTSFMAKFFLAVLWRPLLKKASKYIVKFWGTTPWRCEYLHDVYKIPKEKIDLLVMGADTDIISKIDAKRTRLDVRKRLEIPENAFVVITGGKIDRAKNIHVLAEVVSKINKPNLHLIIFGKPDDEMAQVLNKITSNSIHCIGWIPSEKVYDYYFASDLAVFPGTHSVLWEQSCACGLPGVFKDWKGMHHVDLGGNAVFVKGDDIYELYSVLLEIVENNEKYEMMKRASLKGLEYFSYEEIAKRALMQ